MIPLSFSPSPPLPSAGRERERKKKGFNLDCILLRKNRRLVSIIQKLKLFLPLLFSPFFFESLNSKVYDVTDFLSFHPAGKEAILKRAGKDCTADYNFHSR